MFGRKKRTGNDNIRKFIDILDQFQKEHPDELCPPEVDPQFVVNCLCDVFLGEDWYIALPVSPKQGNAVILHDILKAHSREFRKLIKEKRKEWQNLK